MSEARNSESPAWVRLHRPRHLRRAIAHRRAGGDAQGRTDLVERAARGRRRIRRRRLLGGDQAQGRQGGVATQRGLLQPGEDRAAALRGRYVARPDRLEPGGRAAQHGRAAPHPPAQDHLARLHSARHRTAARRPRRARARHRGQGRGRGYGRLRRAGVLRTPAAGHRRPDGRAAGRPDEAVPLVQPAGRRQDPEFAGNDAAQRVGRN